MQFVKVAKEKKELLVIPFWQNQEGKISIASAHEIPFDLNPVLNTSDFKGKEAESLIHYVEKTPFRLLLLGLGKKDKLTCESIRRSYSQVAKVAQAKKLKTAHLILPNVTDELLEGVAEGIALSNYSFDLHKKEKTSLLDRIYIEGKFPEENFARLIKIAEGVHLARDLVNGNADDVTPDFLSDLAKQFEKKSKLIKTKVLRQKEMAKEGMDLFLAVSRASSIEPALIVMQYQGAKKSKEHPVILGKGITYDTGGLLIKPRGGMETMRCDMAGAANCFGILHALSELKAPINVTFVIASTENGIGSKAYKPGDVYKSFEGKTVEVVDTDAEGRLVLADAIGYAKKYLNPTELIDMATLTGAMVVALGEEIAGFFSNNESLASNLKSSSDATYERLWQMPLCLDYLSQLKSDIADIKNKGDRNGGSISAALFLQEFVGDIPWAHLDIAGSAFYSKERFYQPKNGTGFGVRTLLHYLLK